MVFKSKKSKRVAKEQKIKKSIKKSSPRESMPKPVDSSWMKRGSELEASDKKNAVRSSQLAKSTPAKTKDIELKPLSFPSSNVLSSEASSAKLNSSKGKKWTPKKHKRSESQSEMSMKMGNKIGASKLHWLKRNWILCGLIIFALFGALTAIIMIALPCVAIYRTENITISLRANTVVNSQSVKCLLANGLIVDGTCPSGYVAEDKEVCALATCTDINTGLITTTTSNCNRTLFPANYSCPTQLCYFRDVEKICNASTICKNTAGLTVKQECGTQTITTCETTIGGGDGSTSVHTFAQVNGVCPRIDLCTYCDDKNAGNLYLEYVEANGCPTVPSEPAGGADIVTKKNIMLQPSDGCQAASRRTVTTRTVNVVKTVDVDAMVLLDVSGSVSNPDWDLEVDVAVKVLDTIDSTVKDADVEHKKVGYVAWSTTVWAAQQLTDMKVQKTIVQEELVNLKGNPLTTGYAKNSDEAGGCGNFYDCPTSCPDQSITFPANGGSRSGQTLGPPLIGKCPLITGNRPGLGGTFFSNPLAECADQMLNSVHKSSKANGYKMCMLITDGANGDGDNCAGGTNLNRDACKNVCNGFTPSLTPGSTCTAEKLAWSLKDQTSISIVAACVKCSDDSKRNAYCHSDCNKVDESISACKAKLPETGTALNDKLEECTEFVVADDFSTLEAKLVAMTKTLTQELGTEVVSSTTVQDVTTEQESVAPTQGSSSQSSSTQDTATTAPAIGRKTSISATDSVDTGKVEAGCNDPAYLWLLLFFLPLIFYLLYYPFKRHYQAKKDHLRELLHERRLLNKMDADEIRAAVAAEQANLNAGNSSGGGTGGKKKKYKWDIKAADQYLWASAAGGAMKVDFGKMGAPASAPKGHHTKKELRMSDGRVLKGAEAEAAIQEMKEADAKAAHEKYEAEIRLAEELERAGKLEEDGDFWLRCCPCCREILVEEGEVDEERIEIEKDLEEQKKKASGKAGQHNRGDSLFADKRANNAANPAAAFSTI